MFFQDKIAKSPKRIVTERAREPIFNGQETSNTPRGRLEKKHEKEMNEIQESIFRSLSRSRAGKETPR